MFAIRKVQTRPSTDVAFWTAEQLTTNTDYLEYFIQNYARTGKFLYTDNQLSKDKLKLTVISMWRDKEACDEFRDDPVVRANFINAKADYFQQVGIIEETISYETVV